MDQHNGTTSTDENPADIATGKFTTSDLSTSMWLRGPDFLHTTKLEDSNESPH